MLLFCRKDRRTRRATLPEAMGRMYFLITRTFIIMLIPMPKFILFQFLSSFSTSSGPCSHSHLHHHSRDDDDDNYHQNYCHGQLSEDTGRSQLFDQHRERPRRGLWTPSQTQYPTGFPPNSRGAYFWRPCGPHEVQVGATMTHFSTSCSHTQNTTARCPSASRVVCGQVVR